MEEKLSVEQAFERLDTLIKKLESEELSMEESFAAYAEGLSLVKSCREGIDEIEKKVLVLEESGDMREL